MDGAGTTGYTHRKKAFEMYFENTSKMYIRKLHDSKLSQDNTYIFYFDVSPIIILFQRQIKNI